MAGPVTPVEPEAALRTPHVNRSPDVDEATKLAIRHDAQKPSESDPPPRVGAPLDPQAISSSSDRLRAVYLLTSDFADDELQTAITSPPGSHADANSPALHTEPVDRPVLLRMDGVQAG